MPSRQNHVWWHQCHRQNLWSLGMSHVPWVTMLTKNPSLNSWDIVSWNVHPPNFGEICTSSSLKTFMFEIFQAEFYLDTRATQAHWAYSRLRYSCRFLINFHWSRGTNTEHLDGRQTLTINMLSYAICFHVSLFWRFKRVDMKEITCPRFDEPAAEEQECPPSKIFLWLYNQIIINYQPRKISPVGA